MLRECSDGVERDILSPGTRVVDKHGNRGRIKCIEMRESGRPSPLSYNIDWDDNEKARETRNGWFWIYACPEEISEEE
jgi:hypothetical protein